MLKGKLVAVIPRESSTWWVEFIDDKADADRDVFSDEPRGRYQVEWRYSGGFHSSRIGGNRSRRDGGRLAGQMDLEELQAKALQLFLSADLLPAFYADRIEAEINLSPTGDVLYSHDFEELAIKSAAEVRHEYERDRKSTEYVERFTVEREPKEADTDLKRALTAEYGVPSELVASFSDALVELSQERGAGVFIIRRSGLIAALSALGRPPNLPGALASQRARS